MKLKEALKKKKFVVTSEVQSPIDQEPEELVESLSRVRGRVMVFRYQKSNSKVWSVIPLKPASF